MPRIEVLTIIKAPVARCFWLALSPAAHAATTSQTGEQVLNAPPRRLLQLGDVVTFRARHLGVWQTLSSQITALQAPHYFCDEMRQGAFKQMRHEHFFEPVGPATHMRDVFSYTSPLGPLGRLADALVLTRYLRRFLEQRGQALKQLAETEAWQEYAAN